MILAVSTFAHRSAAFLLVIRSTSTWRSPPSTVIVAAAAATMIARWRLAAAARSSGLASGTCSEPSSQLASYHGACRARHSHRIPAIHARTISCLCFGMRAAIACASASGRWLARTGRSEARLRPYRRLRDWCRRAGHERRARLVEESERQGELERWAGQRRSSDPTAPRVCGSSPQARAPGSSRAQRRTVARYPSLQRTIVSMPLQWFAFAAIALIIYGLAVRKRLKERPRP